MSENLPAAQDSKTPAEYSAEQMQTIRNICAPDCTDNEFYVFMHLCKTYELDPFLGQIYAIKPKGKAAKIFCGKDGMLAIAHRSGQFNGMESGTRIDPDGEIIGWAKVYRKDAEFPFYSEVRYGEYNQNTSIWQTKKHTMIEKVAKVHALRDAFTIAGLYTEDEIDVNSLPRRDASSMPSPGAGPDTGTCIVEGCGLPVDEATMEKIRPYLEKMGGPMCRNHAIEWFNNHPEAMEQ